MASTEHESLQSEYFAVWFAGAYRQVLGQKIEIVLQQNPYLLGPGDSLDVKVLFEGKPLVGKASGSVQQG